MKSTYKLLGLEWDHYHLPSKIPDFTEGRDIDNYIIDRTLFDLKMYERSVNVSEVLSSSPEKLSLIIKKISECDCVYLNIDYEPQSVAKDVQSFYYLRVLQAIAYFEGSLKNTLIKIIATDRAKRMCIKMWKEKEKQTFR